MPADAVTNNLPLLPDFDDCLKAVGGQFGMPEPRQNHVANTLAQIQIVESILVQAGQLPQYGPAAYPGYMKLLAGQARAFVVTGQALVKFLTDTAKALGVDVPDELSGLDASGANGTGASELPKNAVKPASPNPATAPSSLGSSPASSPGASPASSS